MSTRYEAALEKLRAAEREYEAACKEVREAELDAFKKELSALLLKHGLYLRAYDQSGLPSRSHAVGVVRPGVRGEPIFLGILGPNHQL